VSEGGERRRSFSYRGFRFEKAQAGWDIWRGERRIGGGSVRDHAKAYVDELLEREKDPGSRKR